MSGKPMRELMPEITALVDALRARGMTDNATLSAGLKDGTFWAHENGHTIGDPSLNKDVGVVPALPLEAEARLLDARYASEVEKYEVQ